jgi:hypothetical protein
MRNVTTAGLTAPGPRETTPFRSGILVQVYRPQQI